MSYISTTAPVANLPVVLFENNWHPIERRRRGRPFRTYQNKDRDITLLALAYQEAARGNYSFDEALRGVVRFYEREGDLDLAHPTTHLKRLRRLHECFMGARDADPFTRSIEEFIKDELLLRPPPVKDDETTRAVEAFAARWCREEWRREVAGHYPN